MTCDDNQGRHWTRLSYGLGLVASTQYHGANWCKGGWTKYSNFLMDLSHKAAADMMCDYGAWHFVRPSLGNGYFYSKTYRLLNHGWCNPVSTHYADVNGNGVTDLLCSWKGHHWVIAH